MSPQVTRRLALAAVLAGLVALAQGALQILWPQADTNYHLSSAPDYIIQGLIVTYGVLILSTLLALHLTQAGSRGYGRLGTVGFVLAALGQGVILAANAATLLTGENPLGFLHAIGFLTYFPGILLLAAVTFRARILPRWSPLLFIASPIALIALGNYGLLANGVIWIGIGYAILSAHTKSREAARHMEQARV